MQSVFLPKFSVQNQKGGGEGTPLFCVLFWANNTLLATKRGGAMAQCPT